MRLAPSSLYIIFVAFLMVCFSTFAHHGAAAYDQSQTVTFNATVTDFVMGNPHAQIYFDAKDEHGTVDHWACELNAPSWLLREGWTRNTLKAGDQVVLVVHPNRKPEARVVFLVKAVLPDGKELQNGPPK